MAMLDTRENGNETLVQPSPSEGGAKLTNSALSSLAKLSSALNFALGKPLSVERRGKVVEARGTMIKATGIAARVGEICILSSAPGLTDGDGNSPADFQASAGSGNRLLAEVVGVAGEFTLLTPLGDIAGISTVTEVDSTDPGR
jgi:ATP synthase in type III secretion protein N